MSYRPPARPPKGAWAKHLHAKRLERGLSATQAFELVYERLGLSPKSRAVYTALDSGTRQPREDEAAVLAAEFGWPPDADLEPVGATETPDALVSALGAQTAAIEQLVAELAQGRADQQAATEVLLRALASLVPARAGRLAGSGRDARAGVGR